MQSVAEDLEIDTDIDGGTHQAALRLREELGLVDERTAASALGVPLERFRYWRTKGDGPDFIRLGEVIAYERHALRAFVVANRQSRALGAGSWKRRGLTEYEIENLREGTFCG